MKSEIEMISVGVIIPTLTYFIKFSASITISRSIVTEMRIELQNFRDELLPNLVKTTEQPFLIVSVGRTESGDQ